MVCFEKGCFFLSLLPILLFFFLRFEKRGRKALWNLSKRCGLGWACMGASVPKNGNNRPLSLPLEKLFPQVSFLRCKGSQLLVSWIMSSAGCYRSKVRGRNKKKGEVCTRLVSGVNSRLWVFFESSSLAVSSQVALSVWKLFMHLKRKVCTGLKEAAPDCLIPSNLDYWPPKETSWWNTFPLMTPIFIAPAWPSLIQSSCRAGMFYSSVLFHRKH